MSREIFTSGWLVEEKRVALDPSLHQQMTWCANCGGQQIFLAVYEFDGGRVGCCLGCGEERVVPFSRVTTEVA